MKRALVASAFSLCLGLLIVSAWLVIYPITAFAADGKANCGGGWSVLCPGNGTAVKCDCVDGSGCTATFADGSKRTVNCSDFDGPAMEESAY